MSPFLPDETALPVSCLVYCHSSCALPIPSMRGITTCLTKVLRRPALRCTSSDDCSTSCIQERLPGVLRMLSYSFHAGHRCCSAFLACVVPSGLTWVRSGLAGCRFTPQANARGHVCVPLRPDSAETRLVRRVSQPRLAADRRDPRSPNVPRRVRASRFPSVTAIKRCEIVARTTRAFCMTLTCRVPDLSRDFRPHAVYAR